MRDVLEFWIQCRCSKWPPSASKHCRSRRNAARVYTFFWTTLYVTIICFFTPKMATRTRLNITLYSHRLFCTLFLQFVLSANLHPNLSVFVFPAFHSASLPRCVSRHVSDPFESWASISVFHVTHQLKVSNTI